jgi:hypothetical protein
LASLLAVDPELRRSRFAWLRDYSESPAPSNIVALLDRLEYARGLRIDPARAGLIHAAVEGSRQYQDFDSTLIPEPTFALLKAEGPLPVAIDANVESYLDGRRAALDREVEEVGRAGVIGTAGLSFLRGTDPVIATETTTGRKGPSTKVP